jgi:nucleoside-diphosphate-sugar epimerase
MDGSTIVMAGATGDLGGRIARAILGRGGSVRAIVRVDCDPAKIEGLRTAGATIVRVARYDVPELTEACRGAACVVSALSGLRDVIVEAQSALLDAAVAAGVPRFIPSDYCIDYTRLSPGTNRNLDLRREFGQRLDPAPIAATSILNGMFTHLLTGEAPVILFRVRRVLHWGDPDQLLDFTTMDDSARYTAQAALDPTTPRLLRIAGDQISPRGLADVAGELTHQQFKLLRPGGLRRYALLIRLARFLSPQAGAIYPPWQGMQYMHNMFSGLAKLTPLDNDRYPGSRWTTVREGLAASPPVRP